MNKIKIGKWNWLWPVAPVLVGTNVNEKPNYITIGLVGFLSYDMISVSIADFQYSCAGIKENKTFSINQPSASLIKELDYCGSVSGKVVDKSALFENFYGDLKTAPMIRECPLNLECRVIQTIERQVPNGPLTIIFIGEVNEAYVDESCITEDGTDIQKIDPVLYSSLFPKGKIIHRGDYWRLGEHLGAAWEIGKELKSK